MESMYHDAEIDTLLNQLENIINTHPPNEESLKYLYEEILQIKMPHKVPNQYVKTIVDNLCDTIYHDSCMRLYSIAKSYTRNKISIEFPRTKTLLIDKNTPLYFDIMKIPRAKPWEFDDDETCHNEIYEMRDVIYGALQKYTAIQKSDIRALKNEIRKFEETHEKIKDYVMNELRDEIDSLAHRMLIPVNNMYEGRIKNTYPTILKYAASKDPTLREISLKAIKIIKKKYGIQDKLEETIKNEIKNIIERRLEWKIDEYVNTARENSYYLDQAFNKHKEILLALKKMKTTIDDYMIHGKTGCDDFRELLDEIEKIVSEIES